jgi:hypothetical protein
MRQSSAAFEYGVRVEVSVGGSYMQALSENDAGETVQDRRLTVRQDSKWAKSTLSARSVLRCRKGA